MACINPPDQDQISAPRYPRSPTFTLGSVAIDGAAGASNASQVEYAEAKQAGYRAFNEIKNAQTAASVDQALEKGKSALETALEKVVEPAQKQSLHARIRNLQKAATERKVSINTSDWDPVGSKNPLTGVIITEDGETYTVSWKSGRKGTIKEGHTLIADGDFSSEGKTRKEAKELRDEFRDQENHNHYGPDSSNPGQYFNEDRGAYTGPDH